MPRPVRTAPATTKSPAPSAPATRAAAKRSAPTPAATAKGPAAGRSPARSPTPVKAAPSAVPPIATIPAPAAQAPAASLDAVQPIPVASTPAAPKRKKPKLVRDGYTMPEADYALLGALKKRALHAGHEVKKSELLRAGLRALAAMPDASFISALEAIERIKPGRPASD